MKTNFSDSEIWPGKLNVENFFGNFFKKKFSGAPDYSGPYLSKNPYFNEQRARGLTINID